jgi:nicotinamidase-related amidase
MAFDIGQLLQPGRVALLLSEVQRSVIGDKAKLVALAQASAEAGVIPNSARLAIAARKYGGKVVHCLASTDPRRFGANTNARLFHARRSAPGEVVAHDPSIDVPCPEVWQQGDIVSLREHGLNPMADSQLDHRLRNAGITTVIITGVSLNVAILNLAMDAVNKAYQVIIARDAVAGIPLDYAGPVMANTLSPIATLATTEEIITAWSQVQATH